MTSAQAAMVAELQRLRDPQERFAWLVERARRRPLLPAELRTEERQVPGCLSRLWFVAEWREGRCWFRAESDSLVVKAIAGLLCEFYSGLAPQEVAGTDPRALGDFGVAQHLSANRRNALARVTGLIRDFAAAHSST